MLSGCSFLWNLTNAGTLKKNIKTLLAHHEVTPAKTSCTMIDATRSGMCQFSASQEDVTKLVDGLHLISVDARLVNGIKGLTFDKDLTLELDRIDHDFLYWQAEDGCRDVCHGSNEKELFIYRSERRSQELRLGDDSAFEYLLLYYNKASKTLCIQVSYSYG